MFDHQNYATWLKVLATLDEAQARWFVAALVHKYPLDGLGR
jgi:hypothetical protein